MGTKVIGMSVQGASHKRAGKECQDINKHLVLGDAVILAVADGHGSQSCPFSKTGAIIAVNVFCKLMADYYSKYTTDMTTLMTYLNREGDTAVARAIDEEWKRRVEKAHVTNKREIPKNESDEISKPDIWKQYGSTLLGLLITPSFYFAFQLGDGDALFINDSNAEFAVRGDKLLGIETFSLSRIDAWKNAITKVGYLPERNSSHIFMLATDGFSNSYSSEEAFLKTCVDYHTAIREHGVDAVSDNLKTWLNETSEKGSGDDITVMFAIM